MQPTIKHSRRNLLRGKIHKKPGISPPWSLPDAAFLDNCTRCNECITACETGLLIKGDGGFPEADFRLAECTFCEACVDSCAPKALQKNNDQPPWQIQAHIKDTCLARNKVHCRTCSEHCESEAIHFQLAPGGIALPTLDTDLCNGCGACISTCPISAITMHSLQQPPSQPSTEKNL